MSDPYSIETVLAKIKHCRRSGTAYTIAGIVMLIISFFMWAGVGFVSGFGFPHVAAVIVFFASAFSILFVCFGLTATRRFLDLAEWKDRQRELTPTLQEHHP